VSELKMKFPAGLSVSESTAFGVGTSSICCCARAPINSAASSSV
jgi:hypothetical protein